MTNVAVGKWPAGVGQAFSTSYRASVPRKPPTRMTASTVGRRGGDGAGRPVRRRRRGDVVGGQVRVDRQRVVRSRQAGQPPELRVVIGHAAPPPFGTGAISPQGGSDSLAGVTGGTHRRRHRNPSGGRRSRRLPPVTDRGTATASTWLGRWPRTTTATTASTTTATGPRDYQSSTMTALLDGVYDGGLTYGELEQQGDFGLGTFNELDREMVAVDGRFFQLRSDGTASPVTPDERTPFAAVTYFRATSPSSSTDRSTSPPSRPGWTTSCRAPTCSTRSASTAGSPR